VLGYKVVPPLATDTDEPSYVPEYLQYPLLVHGAASLVFSKMEDGIEVEKPNTVWSGDEIKKGMADLHAVIGRNRNHVISSVWRV
jgi:hypothetical protein